MENADNRLRTICTVHGNDALLGKTAAVLGALSTLLWTNGKRFQVIIDCDPQSGRVTMEHRETTA